MDGRLSPQFCIEQAVSAARDSSATLTLADVLGGDNSPSSVPSRAIFFRWSGPGRGSDRISLWKARESL